MVEPFVLMNSKSSTASVIMPALHFLNQATLAQSIQQKVKCIYFRLRLHSYPLPL
ncbi:hypothetical protein A2U01_0057015, partial [Trifolium medium]|nr:hypothetical protein [Trifolium medium]